MSEDEGSSRPRKGPRFSWTPAYETTFFQSLCDSVRLGLKDNHSFKQDAWNRAAAALQQQHGAYPNKGHLINKSDNARKKFRLWRGLREDPEFIYNPVTHMVTGSDEAWKRHIEREPLSRSLKGRPFEHENYLEVLFPDVIGSGGAPKRITKQRRKDTSTLPGQDDQDGQNTTVLGLIDDTSFVAPQAHMGHTGGHIPTPIQTSAVPVPSIPPPQQQQQLPISNGIGPNGVMPNGMVSNGMAANHAAPRQPMPSTNALTPPEETGSHTRKRFMAPDAAHTGYHPPDKRRRTAANAYVDLSHPAQQAGVNARPPPPPQQQQQTPQQTPLQPQPQQQPAVNGEPTAAPAGIGLAAHQQTIALGGIGATLGSGGLEDLLLQIAEAIKASRQSRWPERAMEIFFNDFSDEDPDLQLKIAEKMLTDTNKAIMFCKMTPELRQCWVKRLREAFNRIGLGS